MGSTCTKDVSPTTGHSNEVKITTNTISNIGITTATAGGNVLQDEDAIVTSRGVCFSTGTTPTTANSKTSNGSGKGSYVSPLTGLKRNTTYYVRAYCMSASGTHYGETRSFRTLP